jgi:hypothetical protein
VAYTYQIRRPIIGDGAVNGRPEKNTGENSKALSTFITGWKSLRFGPVVARIFVSLFRRRLS